MGRGGTKTEKLEFGMEKKWNRHFTGRFRIMAYACAVSGFVILILNTFIWSQFYFVTTFNSILTFELVVDERDMNADDWTFKRFIHYKQAEDARLTQWYFFQVKNPAEVMGKGRKPEIEEIGPFAAVLDTVKYDVSFTQDDFQYVTYKEYTYYRNVPNPGACERMFYQMGLGTFVSTDPTSYCIGLECRCKDLDTEVTTFNHVYARLIAEYKPHGLAARLSRGAFEMTNYYLSGGPFMDGVKGHSVEALLLNALEYRRTIFLADFMSERMKEMQRMNGTQAPFRQFVKPQDEVNMYCGDVGFDNRGNEWSGCPWGVQDFITGTSDDLACDTTAKLTIDEAVLWLGNTSWPYSFLNRTVGMPLWIAAGRYFTPNLDDMLLEGSLIDDGTGGERAYTELLDVTLDMQNKTQPHLHKSVKVCHATAKISGIVHWMFSEWLKSDKLAPKVAEEWADPDTPADVGCDVGTYYIEGNARNRIPIITQALYEHACNLPITPWLPYFESEMGAGIVSGVALNATVVQALVNSELAITGINEVSLLLDENRINYWAAWSYANLTMAGHNTDCENYFDNFFAGAKTAVLALSDRSGVSRSRGNGTAVIQGVKVPMPTAKYQYFQALASAIGAYLYEGWAQSAYMEHYVITWFNDNFHEGVKFTKETINEMGYAQFAGSYVTEYMFGPGAPSVRNLDYTAWWAFAPPEFQTFFFMEFKPNAIVEGYPYMNMSFYHGKTLLKLLSTNAEDANAFREFLLYTHTTYHCDAPEFVQYMCDNSLVNNEDLYCKATQETFIPFYAKTGSSCNPGDNYYIEQHVFANFSWNSPFNPINVDAIKYETVTRQQLEALLDFLNRPLYSTTENCEALDQIAYQCTSVDDDKTDSVVWLTNCDEFVTQMEDSAFGLYCTSTGVGLAYNSHPFPMKRANVLAKMIQTLAYNHVLRYGRYFCKTPGDCDFKKGGVYTTRTARELLFSGYVDPIAMKVLNEDLYHKNISLECVNKSTVAKTDFCYPIDNIECTDEGFNILYHGNTSWNDTKTIANEDLKETITRNGTGENATIIKTVSRTGENAAQWYSTFLEINGIKFRNPAFAYYQGMLWNGMDFATGNNDTLAYKLRPPANSEFVKWQKSRSCGMAKFGGEEGRFESCETTVNTGRVELNRINEFIQYHGNTTFYNSHEYGMDGGFNLTGTGYFQYAPKLWEGFANYADGLFFYWFRAEGLEYNYEPTIPMVVPEELLNFEMTRVGSRTVIWPPRMQMFENNNSAELNLRTIKYSVREFGDAGGGADWQEAADRAGRSYKDLLGMPYTIPKGMSSLELLTDMPLFVGTPHRKFSNPLCVCYLKVPEYYHNLFHYICLFTVDYFNKGMSGYEFLQFVGLDASTAERYDEFETYIEIDPITGKLMRGAKRFQYNYRIETNSLNPDLVECISPTDSFSMNGYGCVIYHVS